MYLDGEQMWSIGIVVFLVFVVVRLIHSNKEEYSQRQIEELKDTIRERDKEIAEENDEVDIFEYLSDETREKYRQEARERVLKIEDEIDWDNEKK